MSGSPVQTPLTISFVGDVSFGDCLFCQGMGIRSLSRRLPRDHFFAGVTGHLRQSDLAFCNLETVLSREGEDDSRLATVDMRGDPECVQSLSAAGFSMANFANNHAAQHGRPAFEETVRLLSGSGVRVVGLKGEPPWHCQPVIVEVKGRRLGLLGYSFVHHRDCAEGTPYADGEPQPIDQDIRRLRPMVDLLFVSAHWGLEYLDYPSPATVRCAHAMVDAGADAVIGHHPHVLQGVELYRGKPIAYSLGNFLFDMMWSEDYRSTMILDIVCAEGHLEWSAVPARIGADGRVVLLAGSERQRALAELHALSLKIPDGSEEPGAEYAYQREFDRKNNLGRLKSYLYFLANFHRYRKRYLFQQLKRTIGSRIEDIKCQLL